ncbi:AraC family transcriptional regulator [Porphyromonas pogonae]|uniref:AraC family transcriptional regulator n=1 Tax=Porphyromonas pogonae TaxID=867595 RepID=UPI002E796BCB|nr:AraC family transcriptional regulator [Porphyromonas pogonae]
MDINLVALDRKFGKDFVVPYTSPQYHVLLFRGKGSFMLDFTSYDFSGDTVLFFTPYQTFHWLGDEGTEINVFTFHGDFYCIEQHKKEVACNGLLFNNIYLYPHITISNKDYDELQWLLGKIKKEMEQTAQFSDAVVKAYLQLVLALCSREKTLQLQRSDAEIVYNRSIAEVQDIIDQHFITRRDVAFYASMLGLSPNAFTKRTKQYFGKTPTRLIQDRVILEAKKMLHLSYSSVKEIAAKLHFDDEFYFSRYFKKAVGLSPAHYRDQVGVSIVAK